MRKTGRRGTGLPRLLLLLGSLAAQSARCQDPAALPWVEGSATVVLLPDTQWYTKSRPQFLEAQTRWVLTNRTARNIACVIHLGDITESNTPAEWDVARGAFVTLDGVVPYILVPGNHDYAGTNRQTLLSERFPVELLRRQPAFGGHCEAGGTANSYRLVTIGGQRWLVLGLEFGPRDEVIEWANGVLDKHAECPAIVATHAYLFRDNTRFDHTRGAQRGSPHDWGNDGEELWQKLVSRHANVKLVVCGHVRSGGVAHLASRGAQGQLIHQMLSDYEAVRGNGAGFLRLLEFLPDGTTLQVKTYSPVLNRCMPDPQNQFAVTLSAEPQFALRLDKGQWTRVPVRTVADVQGASAPPPALDRFGGLASSNATGATGFFRTECRNGRWTLLDPEAHPFISIGLCSVNLGNFAPGAEAAKFGSRTNWAEQTAALLRRCGFNTLGRWSDAEPFHALREPFVYTTSLSFMAAYDKQRPARYGGRGIPARTIPVFDPEFPEFANRLAEPLERTRNDPWLLGHFSDNELPFRPDALTLYLELPDSDPGHAAAVQWLAGRKRSREEIRDSDQLDFLAMVADRYFSTVRQAILKHDPNHLYLGSRLNGRNINDGTLRGSSAVDVVSINMYHCWSLDDERVNRWAALSGRPILCSEWYAMTLAAETTETTGAGFRVKSQRDRGLFYQNLALGMLGNPNCVGWHWFKYGGDGDDSSRGFVDRNFKPHGEMTELMRQLNANAYALRDVLLR
jgi:hypothetical protein